MSRTLTLRDVVGAAGFILGLVGSVDTVVVNHPSPLWWALLGGLAVLAVLYAATFAFNWDLPLARGRAEPVAVRSVTIEDGRAAEPPLNWPLKLRITLHNEIAEAIEVGRADWVTGMHGAQLYRNPVQGFRCLYQVEQTPDGAERDAWQNEADQVAVPGRAKFRMWVGVDPSQDPNVLRRLHDERRLGTLVLPVTVGGTVRVVRVAL